MLVLTLTTNQQKDDCVNVYDEHGKRTLRICATEIKGNKVKLSFDGEARVMRKKVCDSEILSECDE